MVLYWAALPTDWYALFTEVWPTRLALPKLATLVVPYVVVTVLVLPGPIFIAGLLRVFLVV